MFCEGRGCSVCKRKLIIGELLTCVRVQWNRPALIPESGTNRVLCSLRALGAAQDLSLPPTGPGAMPRSCMEEQRHLQVGVDGLLPGPLRDRISFSPYSVGESHWPCCHSRRPFFSEMTPALSGGPEGLTSATQRHTDGHTVCPGRL